jgi:hypothetical protein
LLGSLVITAAELPPSPGPVSTMPTRAPETNLQPVPGMFPDYLAPVIRNVAGAEPELAMVCWACSHRGRRWRSTADIAPFYVDKWTC